MQDFLGIRIVLYFRDDIAACIKILTQMYSAIDSEYDALDSETFKPQRINYIFPLPRENVFLQRCLNECLIDYSFEVQIRTVFSEGWHEVEHDIRYKYRLEWDNKKTFSRELNGVFATVELCDNTLISICDKVAYQDYKSKSWSGMIRNKFRLRFLKEQLSGAISNVLAQKSNISKVIYRFDRERLIELFYETGLPKKYDNAVYLILLDEKMSDSIDIPELIQNRFMKMCQQ